MQVAYATLKAGTPDLAALLSATRSRRNLLSRKRAEEAEERRADGVRRRRKRIDEREAEAFLRQRIHVRCSDSDRPNLGTTTARRLYHRAIEKLLAGTTGTSSSRGADGFNSIHYSFTARGFGSRSGRRWRTGEAERAVLYAVREDALEGGEHGWWSNVAADRSELAAHYRALENLERHDRKNANVYVVELAALPAELTARQRRLAVRRICDKLDERGLGYTVGIHLPDRAGDQRNFHLHLIYSLRPVRRVGPFAWEFSTQKVGDINTADGIRRRRQDVVRSINATLAAAHIDKRYTALSNRARGVAPPAKGKVGQAATWIERRSAALRHRTEQLSALHRRCIDLADAVTAGHARFELVRARTLALCTAVASAVGEVAEMPRKLRKLTARQLTLRMMDVAGAAEAASRTHNVLLDRVDGSINRTQNSLMTALIDPRLSVSASIAHRHLTRAAADLGRTMSNADWRLAAMGQVPVTKHHHAVADDPATVVVNSPHLAFGADITAERRTPTAEGSPQPAPPAKPLTTDTVREAGRSHQVICSSEGSADDQAAKTPVSTNDRQAESGEVALRRILLQQELRDHATALRVEALKMLRKRAAKIVMGEDGRCAIDMTSIPEINRKALLQPEFYADLQRILRRLFVEQCASQPDPAVGVFKPVDNIPVASEGQGQYSQTQILETQRGQTSEVLNQEGSHAATDFQFPEGTAVIQNDSRDTETGSTTDVQVINKSMPGNAGNRARILPSRHGPPAPEQADAFRSGKFKGDQGTSR